MPDIAASRPTSGAPVESAWGGQVHDALEGVQAGVSAAITLAGTSPFTGQVNVVFPRAYTAPPVLVVGAVSGSAINIRAMATAVTATGFTAVGYRDGGSAGATMTAHWVAVGTPA